MNKYRTFNTIEEAVKTWNAEYEKALVKSGVICQCSCDIWNKEPWDIDNKEHREKHPRGSCLLLIPERTYRRYGDGQGRIKVTFRYQEKDGYLAKQELCKNDFRITELLRRQLGKKIRLGSNLLVRISKKS